jgi:hypothetical protein
VIPGLNPSVARTIAWKEETNKKERKRNAAVVIHLYINRFFFFSFFFPYLNMQLYLPETRDSPLLETLIEGETYGIGDTGFAALSCSSKKQVDPQQQQQNNNLTTSTSTLESSVDI